MRALVLLTDLAVDLAIYLILGLLLVVDLAVIVLQLERILLGRR